MIRNNYLTLTVVTVALALQGCSEESDSRPAGPAGIMDASGDVAPTGEDAGAADATLESDTAIQPEILGDWKTACNKTDDGIGWWVEGFVFKDSGEYDVSVAFFRDAECKQAGQLLKGGGTYQAFSPKGDRGDLDLTLLRFSVLMPGETQERDLMGTDLDGDGKVENVGVKRYEIYKVVGNCLFLGDDGKFQAPDEPPQRATVFDEKDVFCK